MTHELSPKHRFIFRYGVFGYGGIMFTLFTTIHLVRMHTSGASLAGLPIWLAVNLLLWPLLGYAFGAFAWRRMTRRGTTSVRKGTAVKR
jgi:hypothetical protein